MTEEVGRGSTILKRIYIQRPSRLAPSWGKGVVIDDSSHQLGSKSTMKRKKSNEIPLASLMNDSKLFQKFLPKGVEVGLFCLKVPLELQDYKLAHFIFKSNSI